MHFDVQPSRSSTEKPTRDSIHVSMSSCTHVIYEKRAFNACMHSNVTTLHMSYLSAESQHARALSVKRVCGLSSFQRISIYLPLVWVSVCNIFSCSCCCQSTEHRECSWMVAEADADKTDRTTTISCQDTFHFHEYSWFSVVYKTVYISYTYIRC